MNSFLKTTFARVALATSLLGFVMANSHVAHAAPCDATTAQRVSNASAPTALTITGTQVQRSSMDNLWTLVSGSDDTKFQVLGTAVGAAHNWMGNCTYPGLGLGVGSGYDWSTRNVTLWFWQDGVDLNLAREAVYTLIGEDDGVATISGPTKVLTHEVATFSAANSMPAFSSVTYKWDLDNDGYFETNTGATSYVAHSWSQAGHHVIAVKAIRSSGAFNSATFDVDVMLAPLGAEPGVSILDGAPRTNTVNVTVNVVWPAFATAMRISNDGAFATSRTQTVDLAESVSWQLEDAGEGIYATSIYVRFIGPGIDATRTYSDSIVLNRTVDPVPTTTSSTTTTLAPVVTGDVVVQSTRVSGVAAGVSAMSALSLTQLVSRTGRHVATTIVNSGSRVCKVSGTRVVALKSGVCQVKVSVRVANGRKISKVVTFVTAVR